MVMTGDRPIAVRYAALLKALRDNGGWMSRADLAQATGKRQLSPNDVNHLNAMLDAGVIERSGRPVGLKEEFIYRITDTGKRQVS
jgi:hypothetical protein